MTKTVIRSAYDGNRVKVTVDNKDPSLTVQEQAKHSDIHYILAKYAKTGVVEHLGKYEGQFADVSGLDYQTMQNQIAEVNSAFQTLPAKVRLEQFQNKPENYLDFIAKGQEAWDDMRDGVIGNNPKKESIAAETAPEPLSEGDSAAAEGSK